MMMLTVTAAGQSLGEAARAAKSEKKQSTKKVYTNDDFASQSVMDSTEAPKASAAGETKKDGEKAEDKTADADKEKAAVAADMTKDIEKQKKTIADLERDLDLMEREHKLRASNYYSDIGNQLRDSKKWFEDERKYEEDHSAKQKELAAAREKLDGLQEDARKAGVRGY
jgi:hypothetical protein